MRAALTAILIFYAVYCYAQQETSQWFVSGNRISFTPSGGVSVSPLSGSSFNPLYGSTSVADENGNLLFACDGNTIVNKNLAPMPGLNNTLFFATNNKILAVKVPASSKYYVFYGTPNSYLSNTTWTLKYAVVDLSLNGGLGDVVEYNKVLAADLSQGFTVAQGEGSEDSWLVTHRHATDTFLSYKINNTGLVSDPAISKAGSNPITTEYLFRDLKTSHDGKLIGGIAYRDYSVIFAETIQFLEVFSFDASTGKLANKVRTRRSRGYFFLYQSVEFSPDNRLIYGGYMQRVDGLQPCGFGYGEVIQYNLCYTDSTEFSRYSMTIANKFSWCGPFNSWGRIQLGPDKKIHMVYSGTTVSNIINPNRIGSYANYVFDSYQLSVNHSYYVATPTFHHRLLEKAVKNNIVYEGGCFPNPLTFRITNDAIHNIAWNFGDPASGSNTSNAEAPQHQFSAPGFYTITAQLYNSLGQHIETVTEMVEIKDPDKRLLDGYPKDTIICDRQSVKLKAKVLNGIFVWSVKYDSNPTGIYYNSTGDSLDASSSGTYYVEMRQNDCNGCVLKDSIRVIVLPSPYLELGYDKTLCTGDSVELTVNDRTASYLWSTGDTTTSVWVKTGGKYWVQGEFNHNGCPQTDTIVVTQVPGVRYSFGTDTTLCNNQELLLNPGIQNASYQWQDGSTQSSFRVTKPGTYWASLLSRDWCRYTDTIKVSYINAQQVYLGKDTTLCLGDSLVLRPNITNAQFLWSDGSVADSLVIKASGTYWLEVNNGSCVLADTIAVNFSTPPNLTLGSDVTACEGERVVLRSNVPGATYLWQNGTVLDSIVVTYPGQYWLHVKKEGCTRSDTVAVSYQPLPILHLGGDTSICPGGALQLNVFHPAIVSYTWQNNTTQSSLIVQQEGIYWVRVKGMNGCFRADTIEVRAKPLPQFSLGKDTSLCEGQTMPYNFNLANATYVWNNASRLPSFTVTRAGLYWLQVTQNGCSRGDSIEVAYKSLPVVDLGHDTILCEGVSKQLQALNANASYQWSTEATNAFINVVQPGRYWVSVDLNGCVKKDTIAIDYTYLPRFSLGSDTFLCTGHTLLLDPGTNNGRFLWQDGSTAQTFAVTQPGVYRLTVRNDCGDKTDDIVITKGICKLFMPNTFTPNRDGRNELFRVKYPQFIKTFSMQVLSRWGEVVFSTKDPSKGWDGRYKGLDQPEGNYLWIISLTDIDGNSGSYKGNVLLIR
jgi:gliding motility-associated-like protein